MPVTTNDHEFSEKCAVFGIIGRGKNRKNFEAARLAFYGLWSLQHRGQESSGIASTDGTGIYRHTAPGLVANVYHEEDLEQLPGHIAIGHNRYSTSGGTDDCHNQPFMDRKHQLAFAHNGNIPDCSKLEAFLASRRVAAKNLNDSGMMAAAISCYVEAGDTLAEAIEHAFPLFTGVFSAVAMDTETLVAFRDQCGIRPLSIGTMENGSFVVASETCAFDTIGAKYLRDVKPGEMIIITEDGLISRQIVRGTQKLDIFEFVYFARPDSQLLGRSVDSVRQNFGRELAAERVIEADIVVPVPDSGIPAALGYSQVSGIPFEMGLIKNRYIHRTFIRPTPELRERDLKMKLNPVVDALQGKRVVLVDDSIVRGSTMRQVVSMLFEAGAKEVHLLISSPPVRYPDFYGINTPDPAELIATRLDEAGIGEYVGATSITFLSYDGMIKATGLPASRFSTSCFNGVYPVSIGQRAEQIAAAVDSADDSPTVLLAPDIQTA